MDPDFSRADEMISCLRVALRFSLVPVLIVMAVPQGKIETCPVLASVFFSVVARRPHDGHMGVGIDRASRAPAGLKVK